MDSKLILILVLAGFAVLFIIQNVAIVEIQFLFWSMQISRSLLVFLLLAVGIIIGWFLRSHLKRPRRNPDHGS
ncbi:MAG: LapA family protein [Mariprofundaceae bacterium]|nr:LapA family protein [Mariprofundaceae bacterium]